MTERTFNTQELVEQLMANLRTLAPEGQEYSFTVGYLTNTMADIVNGGIGELIDNVDWTNQRVEALRKVR